MEDERAEKDNLVALVNSVYKKYGNMDVLKAFSLSLRPHEIVCLIGPSGCGKSTLLNLISGLIFPDKGDVKSYSKRIGYVFQEDRLLPWKTVLENIKFVDPNKDDSEIFDLIKIMGLEGFAHHYPRSLSGGMKQRCAIARAFTYDSEILLMDEPFKSLDYTLTIKLIQELIKVWEKRRNTILFVTHDIDEALLLGNRILVLSERPAKISDVFSIDTDQKQRDLGSQDLIEIRSKIISRIV